MIATSGSRMQGTRGLLQAPGKVSPIYFWENKIVLLRFFAVLFVFDPDLNRNMSKSHG
jgi:hypothetical protein